MLILVAAGNDGLKEGTVSGTVGSPATAKNILAVGASQTTTEGWLASTEYTNWNEKRVSAAQQLGVSATSFDCCAASNRAVVKEYCCEEYVKQNIQRQPEKYGEGNMADFSSRGPTADGRVKPEIVAPGQYIISARSDGQKSSTDQCTSMSAALMSMAGTSMATPTAAGNAALLRQYLTEGWYGGGTKGSSTQFSDPSAALMAAMLINGAQSLTGVIDEYNNGESMAPLDGGIFPLSVFQGFGRVTLDRSMWFAGETRYRQWAEDSRVAVATGQDQDYCFTTTGAGQVKATMVYHDAPGQVGAGVAATNNLDLYLGPDADKAVAGNFKVRRDTLNNAESALYDSPAAGVAMFVKVRGINVPQPQQYYALVISGPIDPAGVSFGSSCATAAASGFAIAPTRFNEATDDDHFPLGPVVGGVVGGVGGLAILGALARFCFQRFKGGAVV